LYNNSRIKDSTKINSSSLSIPPEETSYSDSSDNLKENNNNKNYIWGLIVLLALELTIVFNIYIINRSDFNNPSLY
jgi:hypothetical protein